MLIDRYAFKAASDPNSRYRASLLWVADAYREARQCAPISPGSVTIVTAYMQEKFENASQRASVETQLRDLQSALATRVGVDVSIWLKPGPQTRSGLRHARFAAIDQGLVLVERGFELISHNGSVSDVAYGWVRDDDADAVFREVAASRDLLRVS
jgi:hypothetical protein